MSNIELVKKYIERNPKLSDEEVSMRLGVSVKRAKHARRLLVPVDKGTKSKLFPADDKIDVVESPRAVLENRIRELDQSFEISRKEFMIDPNADNASNMNTLLASVKSTLKELDSFNDLSIISERIINEVLVTLTKNLLLASYNEGKKIVEEYKEYFPKAFKYKADEFPKDFSNAIGKESKRIYDESIDSLEFIMKVNLGRFRNDAREDPLKLKKEK
jgi:hypothetical protein